MIGGRLMHGLTHPEAGHVRIPHDKELDSFAGVCPSHGDCFEGLASGPSIEKRWGTRPSELPKDHPAWELEAHYIGLALANTVCTLSPQRIIVGGGVMQHEHLFPLVRSKLLHFLSGYIQHPHILEHIDQFIVPPALGSRSGVLGSAAMALKTLGLS
jgi:fructokinase